LERNDLYPQNLTPSPSVLFQAPLLKGIIEQWKGTIEFKFYWVFEESNLSGRRNKFGQQRQALYYM